MNYYTEIKEKLIKSEIYDQVKDQAKNRNKVQVYFEIGEILSKAGKQYGKNVIKDFADKLMIEVGKKYNERNLYWMRKFYEIFSHPKLNTMCSILSWSHYREVLSLKDINEIRYYLNECDIKNLSQRQLHELIKQKSYQRLTQVAQDKIKNQEDLKIDDLLPNPIIIKSNYVKEELSEYALKESILNNIDNFLFQLGIGFTYVGNEYKIKIGNVYNYIDLLLFNIEYNCYVAVELKVTKLKKEHIGQIEIYMNYIDKNLKKITQDKTIGIIICKKDNSYVIEYCSDKRIIAREYEMIN